MRLFRERLRARLVEKHAISQELARKLIAWKHPGFSAHVGEPIAATDTQALENLAGYVTRNPLSLQRLVYLDGQLAVIYKGFKHNPTLGRDCERKRAEAGELRVDEACWQLRNDGPSGMAGENGGPHGL